MKKSVVLSIVLMVLCGIASAQNTKRADKAFSNSEYYRALQEYLTLENKVTDPATQSHVYFNVAECYRRMNQPQKAEPYYVKAVKAGYMSPDIYFGYGEILLKQAKYAEAKKNFEIFKRSNPENKLVDAKIASCVYAEANKLENPAVKIQPMETINSKGSEYGIAYFQENLIYASTGNPIEQTAKNAKQVDISPRTGLPYSKFYMSISMDDNYNKGELVAGLNKQDKTNEGTFSYDYVNNLGYYTRCDNSANSQCYIYFAKFENNQWKEIDNLKIESRKTPIGHPCVTNNGSRIYFVSLMEGGYGKSDIWYTDKLPDGTWSKPINAGPEVNTAGNEFFPFVADGFLFFSSDGHPGYGGLDIFASKMDVNVHTKAVNIGLPFNSSQDDMNLIAKHDLSETMFVSSRRIDNSDDIFRFQGFPSTLKAYGVIYDSITKMPMPGVSIDVKQNGKTIDKLTSDEQGGYMLFVDPDSSKYELSTTVMRYNPVARTYYSTKERFGILNNWNLQLLSSEAFISGIVTGYEEQRNGILKDLGPIAKATVVFYENGKQIAITETNEKGEYRFANIKEDAQYKVKGLVDDVYMMEEKNMTVGKINQSIDFCKATGYDMDLQLAKIQKVIPINNIHYDLNKATLRPESFIELDKIVERLTKNSNLKVEIRSHTDSRGSVSTNNKLSQNRAKSVVDYLVSKGIVMSRLSAKGFGKSELLVKKEKTEEDYQANRRTEFAIVGKTGEALYDTRMTITPTISADQIPVYGGAYQQSPYQQQPQSPYQQQPQYPQQQQQQYPQQQQQQYPQQQQQVGGSPSALQNMPFRIQVFASRKYDLSKPEYHKIKQAFNLDIYVEQGADGMYRYFVGGYNTHAEAKAMVDRINNTLSPSSLYFVKPK
ncbi:MAG: OmpA family protein [Prevotellaceae bacterium]|jgi:outer membrane protein OmpA-like peptidoglycan-associated protein|nr:OmpA family protein [Prevotellaceae bacterium]